MTTETTETTENCEFIDTYTINPNKDLLKKIEAQAATIAEIRAIRADYMRHLGRSWGTLRNYCGKYSKSVIRAAMEHYPEIMDEEDFDNVACEKRMTVNDAIYKKIIAGEHVPAELARQFSNWLMDKDLDASENNDYSLEVVCSNLPEEVTKVVDKRSRDETTESCAQNVNTLACGRPGERSALHA
jgi:hypothetical protein